MENDTFKELPNTTDVRVYKVIAGGPESSLRDYNERARCDRSLPDSDWRALYTQFQLDHVLGTVPYRWERDESCHDAVLVEATIVSPLRIVVLDGPTWHDSGVSGGAKAALVKQQLGINADRSLMAELGDTGKVALIRETADEWELVFPHDLFTRLNVQERIVARFRRHTFLPVTSKWCIGDCGVWKTWDEGRQAMEGISDLRMDWLSDGTDGSFENKEG